MRGKITKRSVDLLVAVDGKETTLWDTEVRGFGVRMRNGTTKTYVLHYRIGTGRGAPIRKYTIGKHGSPWTPENARNEAITMLGAVKRGADPSGERDAQRQMPSIKELADKFLEEHVQPKRKDRTASEYERLLKRVIIPELGKKNVDAVTRQDIAQLHNKLRATPYQANRILAVLGKMFNLAERWGIRPDGSNPCRHVEKFKEHSRERFLSGEELGRLGAALTKAETAWNTAEALSRAAGKNCFKTRHLRTATGPDALVVSPQAIGAIRLLLFTGARLMEVLTLQWDWVDIERGSARLPDSKTGAKTIHLSPPALEVLAGLKQEQDNPYCFPGGKTGTHLINLEKPWRAVRQEAKLDGVRLHDLRHTHASMGAASGLSLPMIGKMLGHSQSQTTARYAHLVGDPVSTAAAMVARKLWDAMTLTQPGAGVSAMSEAHVKKSMQVSD